MTVESGLVLQQKLILPKIHRVYHEAVKKKGVEVPPTPKFTTEHGAKIAIGKVRVNAVSRDPNVIPVLFICSFLILWFGLESRSRVVRHRKVPRRRAKTASSQ